MSTACHRADVLLHYGNFIMENCTVQAPASGPGKEPLVLAAGPMNVTGRM